jgi:hypothetical protein
MECVRKFNVEKPCGHLEDRQVWRYMELTLVRVL